MRCTNDPALADPALLPAVLDKSLRCYPVGWLGSRETSRAVTFGGVEIPAKTLVFYAPWLTHHDPDLWPDPDRFDPHRFVGAPRPAVGAVVARGLRRAESRQPVVRLGDRGPPLVVGPLQAAADADVDVQAVLRTLEDGYEGTPRSAPTR